MQKVAANDSWVREICYTGRYFTADEAKQFGFVSEVLGDKDALWKRAQELAEVIASKSPVAITAIKQSMNFSRDHTVQEGLDHIALMNASLL